MEGIQNRNEHLGGVVGNWPVNDCLGETEDNTGGMREQEEARTTVTDPTTVEVDGDEQIRAVVFTPNGMMELVVVLIPVPDQSQPPTSVGGEPKLDQIQQPASLRGET